MSNAKNDPDRPSNSDQALGPGATGGWTDEEIDEAQQAAGSREGGPTREDEDVEALREGRAKANRPEKSLDGSATDGETAGRRGIHPGQRGVGRGEKERDR